MCSFHCFSSAQCQVAFHGQEYHPTSPFCPAAFGRPLGAGSQFPQYLQLHVLHVRRVLQLHHRNVLFAAGTFLWHQSIQVIDQDVILSINKEVIVVIIFV